jgi:DNA-binding transcriptional MerR regulator
MPRAQGGDAASAGGSREQTARAQRFYQTRDVVEILGISRRQLQYWSHTDLVKPTATTPGGHRRYSFEDLVALKAAKRLIDAGVSVQRIRSSIRSLRKTLPTVERPLSELVLVATGDIVLVFRDGAAFEAVSGQEWVFQVADFQREVEAWRSGLGLRPAKHRTPGAAVPNEVHQRSTVPARARRP